MAKTKAERREERTAELEKMTIEELCTILPYKENEVILSNMNPKDPKKPSKEKMINTILQKEGL
jgi:hypothetical protein